MDPQLQKQYENYFEMFATQGWKQFVEDMDDIYSSYKIEDIKTEQNLAYVKGERRILHQVLNFEATMRRTYDSLMERSGD